jgi:outer membrane lipoprotein-sorting protein
VNNLLDVQGPGATLDPMQWLRRMPLSRLLLLCGALVALGAVGTALATTLSAGTPPPPKPLADAVHDALAAPAVQGVTARIKFTNSLVDTSSLQSGNGDGGPVGGNPLLRSASGRMWASSDGRVRLELQSSGGDAQIVYDGHTVSLFDSSSNTLYRFDVSSAGSSSGDSATEPAHTHTHTPPSVSDIQTWISHLMQHANVSGAIPGVIAHQAAYTVRLSPARNGGLLGAVELAWDAAHGIPLKLAVYSTQSSSPVLALEATQISFGPVGSSVFALSPANAKVQNVTAASAGTRAHGAATRRAKEAHLRQAPVTGASAVQAQLPFTLQAPATLAGQAQNEVRLLHVNGRPAALVTYGQGLGGLAVLEEQASSTSASQAQSSDPHTLLGALPKVTVNGASASELATPLGTIVHWQAGGVAYTVIGSVTAPTAEQAARGL